MATRLQRKQQVTEYRRKQVLDAALAVFSRKGYGETTIPDIAREAGVAVGTIYNYYPSKRDLLVSLISESIDTDRLVRMINQGPEDVEDTLLGRLIQDRLEMGFGNADRLLVLTSEVYHDASLREQYVEQVARPILNRLEEYMKSGVERQAFRDLDVCLSARALWGMIMGLSIIYMLEGESGALSKMPRDRMARDLAGVLLDGMRQGA